MHSPNPAGRMAVLADVAEISPNDAWAVSISGSKTLIVHWNGTSWRRVPSPSPRNSILTGVSASSARDVWAVGTSGISKTLILHWNGGAWKQVASPRIAAPAAVVRVAAISANDVWATGSSGRGTLILHWNGTGWTRTPSPAARSGAALIGVSATSARNAWAVGSTGGVVAARGGADGPAAMVTGGARWPGAVSLAPRVRPLILHWDGTVWKRVHIPVPPNGGSLIGVFAASRRSAWAVGCTKFFANPKAKPVVLHWNGRAWR